jgi:hypothetical protein
VEPLHLFRWPLSPVPYIGSKDGCRIGNVGHDVGNDAQGNGSVSGLRGSGLGEILRVPQDDNGFEVSRHVFGEWQTSEIV